jgi:hypothetical protein
VNQIEVVKTSHKHSDSQQSDKKLYCHPNLNKLIEMMNLPPESMDEKAIKTWSELGPFKLAEHITKGRININPELEIR